MTSATSCAGKGQRCSPCPNEKKALLPPVSAPASVRICGSPLAAARPRSSRSPARMCRPPSRVSRAAQRPATFWVGVSSQSTSFIASPTLCRPPASEAANRSSVSISRSELPIQSAVGWWPAAIITIRSWPTSSTVKPYGLASIRDATSSPGSTCLAASSAYIDSARWRWPSRAPSRPSIMSFRAVTRPGPCSSANPYSRASTRTGRSIAYWPTMSAAARAAQGVDQLVREPLGVAAQFEGVDGLQRVGDHRGALAVALADRVEDRRLLAADHRQQRPVGGDAVPLVPQVGVAGEQHRVAGDLVQLAVAEHQPGRYVAVEHDGRHGAVVAPHVAVERVRVGLEPGAAQRDGGGDRARHGMSSGACLQAREMFDEGDQDGLAGLARTRASQRISGTSGGRSSASRTCASVCAGPPKSLQATTKGVPWCSRRSMAYQESARRRVSTRTTAPSVPANSRSHRNQNRSWPGAPNRYRTLCASRVMRPKSKATVVAVFAAHRRRGRRRPRPPWSWSPRCSADGSR